jgi:ferredoxin
MFIMETLTDKIKAMAKKYRMDLVGVASIDRYDHAPEMVHPQAHLPEANAVISMAIRYPDAMFVNAGDGDAETIFSIERYQNYVIGKNLYNAASRLTRMLEDHGYKTIPMPVSGKWRIHPYKTIETNWCADFSNRHAAVAAGLAEFGIHALAITPEYGMRQRFISVITEAPLEADPMYNGPSLCDKCMMCFKSCPVKAINPRPSALETVKIGDRTFEYAKIDHWRCGWSEQINMIPEEGPAYAGQDEGIMPPPEGEITDEMFLQSFYKKCHTVGLQAGYTHAMGNCMRMCIPPTLRGKQKLPKLFCKDSLKTYENPDRTKAEPGIYKTA